MNEWEARGREIFRRRTALGIDSVNKFAARTGVSRTTIAKVEAGQGSREKTLQLEEWLAQVEAETLPDGVSVQEVPSAPEEEQIEVEVEGPTTKFRLIFRGPSAQGEELRRQAVQAILDIERGQRPGEPGP